MQRIFGHPIPTTVSHIIATFLTPTASKRRDTNGATASITADRQDATSRELGTKKGRSHRPHQPNTSRRGQLNGNRNENGFGMDRDVNGARGIFLRGLLAQVASQPTLASSNVV